MPTTRPWTLLLLIALAVGCGNASPHGTSARGAPPARVPSEPSEPTPAADPAPHIAALDRASGGSDLVLQTPDAAALVRIGEPALPALIDCFEHDTRQTRIRDDFGMLPTYLDVSTLCLRIAESILDEPGLAYREAGDLHGAAESLRAYIRRYGAMQPVARRVAMLNADTTSDRTASIAARWLTGATGELAAVSDLDFIGTRRHVGRMRGAALRGDSHVDLVASMLPRATRALAAGHGGEACELAAAIVDWDASATPQLLPLGRACLGAMCPCSYAFVALVAHADPAAATLFLDQHGTTLLASDTFSRARGVEMAAALDVPAVRAVVERRLRAMDMDAALHDAVRTPPPPGLVVLLLAWSRAGLVPARDALDHALADHTALATISPDPGADGARVRMPSAEYSIHLPEPITAALPLRASDLVANGLAMELGTPFSLGWPESRRDATIAVLRQRLRSP